MNLIRPLILFLVIWLAIHLLRRLLKRPPRPGRAADNPAGDMVRCAECGLHLPQAEAIAAGGRHFCCEEHHRRSGRQ